MTRLLTVKYGQDAIPKSLRTWRHPNKSVWCLSVDHRSTLWFQPLIDHAGARGWTSACLVQTIDLTSRQWTSACQIKLWSKAFHPLGPTGSPVLYYSTCVMQKRTRCKYWLWSYFRKTSIIQCSNVELHLWLYYRVASPRLHTNSSWIISRVSRAKNWKFPTQK